MKILVLSHRSPLPENHGSAQRLLVQARALADLGHKIVILTSKEGARTTQRSFLDQDGNLELVEVPTREESVRPVRFIMNRFLPGHESPAILAEALRYAMTRDVDLVQMERPYLWRAARVAKGSHKPPRPAVLVEHQVEKLAALDLKERGKMSEQGARDTATAEQKAIEQADLVLATCKEDAEALREEYGVDGGITGNRAPRIDVVPNSIARDRYADVKPDVQASHGGRSVLFLGSGLHYPNQDAILRLVRGIIPAVQRRMKGVEFQFAGSRLPDWLRHERGIKVCEEVDDIRPLVLSSAVCVAPLESGSGTPMKVLEYMAASRPIVTTPRVARGLGLRDGEHALVRSTDDDFADAIVQLIEDRGLAQGLGRAGYGLLCARYDAGIVARKVEDCYEQLLALR